MNNSPTPYSDSLIRFVNRMLSSSPSTPGIRSAREAFRDSLYRVHRAMSAIEMADNGAGGIQEERLIHEALNFAPSKGAIRTIESSDPDVHPEL